MFTDVCVYIYIYIYTHARAPYGPSAVSTCVHRAVCLSVRLHMVRPVNTPPPPTSPPPPGRSCKMSILHRAVYDDSGINKPITIIQMPLRNWQHWTPAPLTQHHANITKTKTTQSQAATRRVRPTLKLSAALEARYFGSLQ